MQFPKTFWLIGVITTELATHPGCARSRERGGSARQGRGTAVAVPPQPVVLSDCTALPSRPSLWAGGEGRVHAGLREREREREKGGGLRGRWGRVRLSSGRPTGAERSGGAPQGQGTAGNPGISCMSTTPAAPWGWRAGRTPGTCGAERGACGVEHAAGALHRAGIAIPCANHRLSNRDFGPRQLCIRPPPGGWRQGRGAPDCMRGREGRTWCGTGRPAGAPAATGARDGKP